MAAGHWRNELFGDWFPLAAKFFKTKGTDLFRNHHWMRLSTTKTRRCEAPRRIPLLPEINMGL
jgi:hypothetical protein